MSTTTNLGLKKPASTDYYDIADFNSNSDKIDTFAGQMNTFKTTTNASIATLTAAVGSPLVANTAAAMTDQTKIYVYTGSETGYTAGNWYYHNGSAWVSGGVYNSAAVETDKTLLVSDVPADAKKTGDEITDLKSALNSFEGNFNIVPTNNFLNPNGWIDGIILNSNGEEVSNSSYSTTGYIDIHGISELGFYYLNTGTGNLGICTFAKHICAYDENKNFISGSHDNMSDGTYTVPNNAVYIRFSVINANIAAYQIMVCNIDESTPTEWIPYGNSMGFKISDYVTSQALEALEFMDGNALSAGDDLNNLDDGIYVIPNNTVAQSVSNVPVQTNMKVIQFNRVVSYAMQIAFCGDQSAWYRIQTGTGWTRWHQVGDYLQYLYLYPRDGVSTGLGNELSPSIDQYTGTDVTYDGGWVFTDSDQSISTQISVEADETYLVELTTSNPYTGADENGVPAYLDVSLGSDTVRMFAANDAYWNVALKPNATGTASFSIESVNHWSGKITNVSIKKVTSFVGAFAGLYNQSVRVVSGANFNIGGFDGFVKGAQNVGFGPYAQRYLTTARWNTAFGHSAQSMMRNGTGNTAVGASAQGAYNNTENTGSYNNCVGNATQMRITTGNWNNAFGNEAQLYLSTGCNNTSIGRRSSSALTTGNYNTHLGMWTGFIGADPNPDNPDNRNTISASRQTLVGAKARQIDHQSDDLVCLGFGTQGDEKAVAIGSGAKAKGEASIAIGYGVQTSNNNEVAIGSSGQKIILAGKVITFNQDGTVTWEAVS